MAKKKIKDLKEMTSEEILNSMKDVKVTNQKKGDVLVGDGKGGMINKPLKEVEQDNLQKIIKLNEELTAENARLLTELEGITEDKNAAERAYNTSKLKVDYLKCQVEKIENDLSRETHSKCNERSMRRDLSEELTSIKSKWWYKLMTWGW